MIRGLGEDEEGSKVAAGKKNTDEKFLEKNCLCYTTIVH